MYRILVAVAKMNQETKDDDMIRKEDKTRTKKTPGWMGNYACRLLLFIVGSERDRSQGHHFMRL